MGALARIGKALYLGTLECKLAKKGPEQSSLYRYRAAQALPQYTFTARPDPSEMLLSLFD